jgi:RecA/RadA recombinase
MGNASDEEYKEEMNERKALRQDVQIYLEADNKLQNQVDKIEFQKCIVDMLERTVDNLKYRSKTIDSMIQLIRFENGA